MYKKVYIITLDDDGLECFREEYSIYEIWSTKYGEVVKDMIEAGVRVRQVGDKIIGVI